MEYEPDWLQPFGPKNSYKDTLFSKQNSLNNTYSNYISQGKVDLNNTQLNPTPNYGTTEKFVRTNPDTNTIEISQTGMIFILFFMVILVMIIQITMYNDIKYLSYKIDSIGNQN